MGVTIWWNHKSILDCSNMIFCILYCTITDDIEKNNLKLNHDLRELIEDLERGCDGWHIDIDEYIFSKEDFLLFIELVENAINEVLSTNYKMIPYRHFYDNFFEELKIAYQDFKPNPLLRRSSNGTIYLPNDEKIRVILKFNKKYILACSKETYFFFINL